MAAAAADGGERKYIDTLKQDIVVQTGLLATALHVPHGSACILADFMVDIKKQLR